MANEEAQHRRLTTIQRADALIEMKRWSQVVEELAPLLAGSDDVDALCRGAQALLALGRYQEAVAMSERAIMAAPAKEWPHRLRSRGLMQLSNRAAEEQKAQLVAAALASAREAVRLAPRSALARRSLAEVQLDAGDYPHASATAAEALNMSPNSAASWFLDGRIALAYGRYDQAERSARRALELQPNDSSIWNNLGVAMHRQGRWREATTAYLQSARLDPQNSVARKNLSGAGLRVMQTLGLLVLLPVLLVPYGPAAYVALFAIGIFLFRPKGILRRRTEMVAIRVAMRLERVPWRQKVSQGGELRALYGIGLVIVLVAFFVIAPNTPAGVTFLSLVVFVVLQAMRAPSTRRRRRPPPGVGTADWSSRGYGRGGWSWNGRAPDHYRPKTGQR